jgi:hypothetical protein
MGSKKIQAGFFAPQQGKNVIFLFLTVITDISPKPV